MPSPFFVFFMASGSTATKLDQSLIDENYLSRKTKGVTPKKVESEDARMIRYQNKFTEHKIDLVIEPYPGFDLVTARKLADFSNLCYYDSHQIAVKMRQQSESGHVFRRSRSKTIVKTLDDILRKDNNLQWCLFTTFLPPGVEESETLVLCKGNPNPSSDTQWLYALSDRVMVVAFRGTESTKFRDILSDLNARLEPDPLLLPAHKRGMSLPRHKQRRVHSGFKAALDDVWPEFLRAVQMHAWDAGRCLYLTGHSLGGALATLAAARLELGQFRKEHLMRSGSPEAPAVLPEIGLELPLDGEDDYVPAVFGLYTFGSPRVFGAVAARKVDEYFLPRHFRFVNNNDIVPAVPLSIMGFRHTGHHVYITSDRTLEMDPPDSLVFFDGLRGRVKAGLLNTELLLDSMTDHSIAEYCAALNHNVAVLLSQPSRPLTEEYAAEVLAALPKFRSMRNFRDENYFDVITSARSMVRSLVLSSTKEQGLRVPAALRRHLDAVSSAVADASGPGVFGSPDVSSDDVSVLSGVGLDLEKAVRMLLTPQEEVRVVLQTSRLDVERGVSGSSGAGDTTKIPNVVLVATTRRLLLVRVRPAAWAEIREVAPRDRPVGACVSHSVEYVADAGMFCEALPYKAITGVRLNATSQVRAQSVVVAKLSFVSYLLLAVLVVLCVCGCFAVAHDVVVTAVSRAEAGARPTAVSLLVHWRSVLVLVMLVYVLFFSTPRFCYNFSALRPVSSSVEEFSLTVGYRDPITRRDCIATAHIDPECDPAVVFHFVRGVENIIHCIHDHATVPDVPSSSFLLS